MGNPWLARAAAANLIDKTNLQWNVENDPFGNQVVVAQTTMPGNDCGAGQASFLAYLSECDIKFIPTCWYSTDAKNPGTVSIKAKFTHQLEIERMAHNDFTNPSLCWREYQNAIALLDERTGCSWQTFNFPTLPTFSVSLKCNLSANSDVEARDQFIKTFIREISTAINPFIIALEVPEEHSYQTTCHIVHPLEIKYLSKLYTQQYEKQLNEQEQCVASHSMRMGA